MLFSRVLRGRGVLRGGNPAEVIVGVVVLCPWNWVSLSLPLTGAAVLLTSHVAWTCLGLSATIAANRAISDVIVHK